MLQMKVWFGGGVAQAAAVLFFLAVFLRLR
jgi:hypothetical protein